ncbi:Cutinase gene palindrome-binding protein [Termitomyces sp. J132]|nr:hypothetical protein H2248_009307 [Termitomyces sp. 'cryptogamus']KNZ78455.1 Cutinase gene palindrome-binding protein [Termitomyces sp. J132]
MSSELTQVNSATGTPKTFEFTKRKRWADLLATELADGINLILSETCIILFCAPVIAEMTGWKNADLLECDFLELIATPEDRTAFRDTFDESAHSNSGLLAYVRINCSEKLPSYPFTAKDVLFEIRGRPRLTDTENLVFFLTIKPYPSRNTESLGTYVDIKLDNDNLQRRHTELSKRLPQKAATSPMTLTPIQIYATSPIQSTSNTTQSGIDASSSYHPPSGSGLTEFDALLGTPFDSSLFTDAPVPPANPSPGEDDNEDTSRRKKFKKISAGEQYVCITCGRTDSPEWRKGPLGPKTLCNACGLRWAKQTRTGKVEDAGDNAQYDL